MQPAPASLKHKIEYAVFLALAKLVRALPVETASNAMGWGWRMFAPLSGRHQRALTHLALAFPDKSPEELQAIAKGMWEMLGRVFAETFHLDEIAASNRIVLGDGFKPMLPADRCFVAVAAHQGNWELGGASIVLAGAMPAGVYQRIKNPLVDAYVRELRTKSYPGGLFAKSDDAVRRIIRHVRRRGAVATMGDLRDNRGIPVPFFGRPAPTSPFPAVIARRFDIPLFAGNIIREPGVRFRAELVPVAVPKTDDIDADIAAATANLHKAFEDMIRARPQDWMWAHRRWG
ncbi:lauroyl acyltransferase [Roseiarcaceae bacterium H3SJ34-1]|uniref:lysophospholipid acyltransferase family protein n=1 Tax=Terripilifer ovatus TaxID=3032367 RepID=UPI003AB962CA|nr:lauroyl acyltransferase [Roseiarcaceae bacterium H3SJ34-1]